MINWIRSLFGRPTRMRELIFVSWDRADRMLAEKVGWRVAPEEDRNKVCGMVFLERYAQTVNGNETGSHT